MPFWAGKPAVGAPKIKPVMVTWYGPGGAPLAPTEKIIDPCVSNVWADKIGLQQLKKVPGWAWMRPKPLPLKKGRG